MHYATATESSRPDPCEDDIGYRECFEAGHATLCAPLEGAFFVCRPSRALPTPSLQTLPPVCVRRCQCYWVTVLGRVGATTTATAATATASASDEMQRPGSADSGAPRDFFPSVRWATSNQTAPPTTILRASSPIRTSPISGPNAWLMIDSNLSLQESCEFSVSWCHGVWAMRLYVGTQTPIPDPEMGTKANSAS